MIEKGIARTILELKGHAVMGGTLLKVYADDIVSESLEDLKELGRLAEIGRATELAIERDFFAFLAISCDSIQDVASLLEWYRSED